MGEICWSMSRRKSGRYNKIILKWINYIVRKNNSIISNLCVYLLEQYGLGQTDGRIECDFDYFGQKLVPTFTKYYIYVCISLAVSLAGLNGVCFFRSYGDWITRYGSWLRQGLLLF